MSLEKPIGKNIKRIRLAKGISQGQLGKKCTPSILQQSLSRYESGETIPTIDTLCRVAKALGVEIGILIKQVSNVEEVK